MPPAGIQQNIVIERDAARVGRQQAGDDIDQRGLAAARAAE